MNFPHPFRFVLTAFTIAAIGFQHLPAVASDAAKLLERIEAANPDWLPDLNKCPVDVMPARETKLDYFKERCATALERCLDSCKAGDAGNCYASALILQEVRNNAVSQALFLRACALGVVSGCTNRASGMSSGGGDVCAVRTYEMACDRDDPLACTMMGFHLKWGIGTVIDPERAKQALSKSCRLSQDDQACAYAKRLMRGIGD